MASCCIHDVRSLIVRDIPLNELYKNRILEQNTFTIYRIKLAVTVIELLQSYTDSKVKVGVLLLFTSQYTIHDYMGEQLKSNTKNVNH